MPTPTETPAAASITFTAFDRCDRCGAQAAFRAVMHAGELLFCGHHGRAYRAEITKGALQIMELGDFTLPGLEPTSADLADLARMHQPPPAAQPT